MPAISASSGDCASWGVLAIDLELLVNRSGQVFLAAESHANAEFEGLVAAEDTRWSDDGTTTTAVSQFRFPSLPTTLCYWLLAARVGRIGGRAGKIESLMPVPTRQQSTVPVGSSPLPCGTTGPAALKSQRMWS